MQGLMEWLESGRGLGGVGEGGRGWRKLPKDEQKMMYIFSWNWRNRSEDEWIEGTK